MPRPVISKALRAAGFGDGLFFISGSVAYPGSHEVSKYKNKNESRKRNNWENVKVECFCLAGSVVSETERGGREIIVKM